MGQQSSRELARMDEILTEQQRVLQILESVPTTDQARRSAIGAYLDRLTDEQMAICIRLDAARHGCRLPMPDRTPPFNPPPPAQPEGHAAAAATEAAPADGVQPDTPEGDASWHGRQRGISSSSSEGAPHAEGSQSAPLLLAAGSGGECLAPGLRRRQGHECS